MDLNLRCAVVIGTSQVNVCILRKKRKKYLVESVAFYDFDEEKEIEDIIYNFSEHLPKGILTNISLRHQSVIEHVYFYKSNTDVRSSVFKDLKRDYEIELKNYIIDYEEGKVGDIKIVYVVAVPKNVFEFFYGFFEKSKKFRLYGFETHSVSLRRSIREFLGNGYMLNCTMFRDYSMISALKDDVVLAMRKLRYSWDELVRSLSSSGGVSLDKADEFLRNRGLKEPENGDEEDRLIYDGISNAFDQFAIEIQRTIDYITTVQKMGKIEKIVTIGEINKINRLDNYITKLFSLETIKFQPQKLVEFGEDIDFSSLEHVNYLELCIGAALKEVK